MTTTDIVLLRFMRDVCCTIIRGNGVHDVFVDYEGFCSKHSNGEWSVAAWHWHTNRNCCDAIGVADIGFYEGVLVMISESSGQKTWIFYALLTSACQLNRVAITRCGPRLVDTIPPYTDVATLSDSLL